MKKNYFYISILIVILITSINFNFNTKSGSINDMMLANIEALADPEVWTEAELAKLGCRPTVSYYDKCTLKNGQTMRYALPL